MSRNHEPVQRSRQWFSWHRRTHLPGYATLLANSQSLVREDITAERTCGLWNDLRGYMDSAFERALPMTAEIVLTLTPQQIQNIERRYAKINEEFNDEHLQRDESRRLKKSIKRTIERAEFFYGDLDKAQQALIAEWVTRSPYEVNIWNAERHRRQQDLVQVLRRLNADNATQDKAQAALRAYLERIYSSPNENYRKYAEQVWVYNCAFVANLHNTTSVPQRKHAAKKLKEWESEIRALVPPTEVSQLLLPIFFQVSEAKGAIRGSLPSIIADNPLDNAVLLERIFVRRASIIYRNDIEK